MSTGHLPQLGVPIKKFACPDVALVISTYRASIFLSIVIATFSPLLLHTHLPSFVPLCSSALPAPHAMNSTDGWESREPGSSASSVGSDVTLPVETRGSVVSLGSDDPKFLTESSKGSLSDICLSDDEHDDRDSFNEERRLLHNTNAQAGTDFPHNDDAERTNSAKESPVSWRSLPRKDQLLVLTLSRLSEPLTQTSLGSYLFYQLKSFDPSLPDSTISSQAGIIQAAFPAAQFLTAMLWGRYADSESGGRKKVVLLGLLGTMFSVLGFGFSHSFTTAVFFRCLGGILNGNIGVLRTMISEIIKEKKFQSRAFLLLPMTFNIGVIVGPILGLSHLIRKEHRLTTR
jgi:hypothetical protein